MALGLGLAEALSSEYPSRRHSLRDIPKRGPARFTASLKKEPLCTGNFCVQAQRHGAVFLPSRGLLEYPNRQVWQLYAREGTEGARALVRKEGDRREGKVKGMLVQRPEALGRFESSRGWYVQTSIWCSHIYIALARCQKMR